MDDVSYQKTISDTKGDFLLYLAGLQPGTHNLKINALDLEETVVSTAGPLAFTYQPAVGDLFLGLDISPSNNVLVDEKLTFTLSTADRVSSAFIKLGDGDMLPTEKVQPGTFRKQIAIGNAGVYPVDVQLSVDGNSTD